MKQTSKRLMSMLAALALLVAALLIFFELIEPAYGNLQMKKGQEVSDAQLLANEEQLVAQAKNLLTQYQNDTAAEQNLSLAMPSGPDVAGGLAQVYGIAAASGLSVKGISIGTPSIQVRNQTNNGSTQLTASQIVKPIGTLSFQMTLFGSYESLKAFLMALETNIRIFDVTSLSIQPASSNVPASSGAGAKGSAAGNLDLFNLSVTAVTYYQST